MWIHAESVYRGQATDGTIVTVDEDAMQKALKNAGKTVFDTDWWLETLSATLTHWGIGCKRWLDDVTNTPRAHFNLQNPDAGAGEPATQPTSTGLLDRLRSSPLSTRQLPEDQ